MPGGGRGGGSKVLYGLCHAEWGGGDVELCNYDTTIMGKG